MIFGDKSKFAIECEPVLFDGRSHQVRFRFWAANTPIGDWEDTIQLHASVNWLKDFLRYSGDRYEPSLEDKSKDEVFRLIYESVVLTVPKGMTLREFVDLPDTEPDENPPIYRSARERFHLDQVGMSSVDNWSSILLERGDGTARLIWRNVDDLELHEVLLPPRYFDMVADQYLDWSRAIL
jgi:hypothetical protein